jgi:hypothetical protein
MNAILSRKMADRMPISRHFGAIDAIARSARASPVLQSALKSVAGRCRPVTLTRLKEVRHSIHDGLPPWMKRRTFPTTGQTSARL